MMSVKILDITKVHQIRMSCKYIRCYKGASDHDVLYTDPDSLLDQTNQMLAFNGDVVIALLGNAQQDLTVISKKIQLAWRM